jgi:hypothetical protein
VRRFEENPFLLLTPTLSSRVRSKGPGFYRDLFLHNLCIYGKLIPEFARWFLFTSLAALNVDPPRTARFFIWVMLLKMILLFRIPLQRKKPETTNTWGGAGQTALPTSFY